MPHSFSRRREPRFQLSLCWNCTKKSPPKSSLFSPLLVGESRAATSGFLLWKELAISTNFALNGTMKRPRRREIRQRIRRQRVPAEQDWGNYQADLDQNGSHQKFAGKTNEQVQRYFREYHHDYR